MNAKELRLGNLVVYNGSVFRVTGITRNRITADRGKGDVEFSISELVPLRITEYWMLKAGFERVGNFKNWKIEYNFLNETKQLTIEGDKGFNASIEYRDKFAMISLLSNIHQLQNLYSDLSGQELQFSEL
jgi:hypothetical protein